MLQSAASTQEACALMDIGWEAAHRLMERAVARGLDRRSLAELEHAGIDEKSFGAGHSYITTLNDLRARRCADAVSLLEPTTATSTSSLRPLASRCWPA